MNQQEFYELPEVVEQIEIQKRNPYGSKSHREAYEQVEQIAISVGCGDEYKKSGGGEY